jgi:predicted transcriptional regulator
MKGVNMLVKNWMSKNFIIVNVDDSMQNAMGLLKQHNIREIFSEQIN